MTALRQIGRRKNLPLIGSTTGEWAGVTTLERVKGRRVPPRRPDRIYRRDGRIVRKEPRR